MRVPPLPIVKNDGERARAHPGFSERYRFYIGPISPHGLKSVDDLAAGGEPDALMLLHMGDGPLEVFDA